VTLAETYIEGNGLRVYYEDYREDEPLFLLHGGTTTSQSWASHLPAFTEHFRIFVAGNSDDGSTQRG
jgi:pimeloyl-ACP methyl ester carboxylesterase